MQLEPKNFKIKNNQVYYLKENYIFIPGIFRSRKIISQSKIYKCILIGINFKNFIKLLKNKIQFNYEYRDQNLILSIPSGI